MGNGLRIMGYEQMKRFLCHLYESSCWISFVMNLNSRFLNTVLIQPFESLVMIFFLGSKLSSSQV